MAYVFKRRKGAPNWSVKYRDAHGKQVLIKAYTDKRASEQYAAQLEDEARKIKLGDIDAQAQAKRVLRSRSIDEHVTGYETSLKAAGRSAGHVSYTIADVRKLIAFSDVKAAGEITRSMIDKWSLSLRLADANKTVNRRVASVQQFLKWCQANGAVNEYVLHRYEKLATGGKHRRRESRPLSPEEVAKLIAAVTDPDRRDLYAFAAKTGLRVNELRQVTFAMIDVKHEQMTLPADVTKAKTEQTVPLHRDVVEIVTRRQQGREPADLIFEALPTRANLIERLKQHCKRAGVDPKNVSMHSFRHGFCTNLARAGVHPALLKELARHADLATTLQFYVHSQRADRVSAINAI